MPKRDIQAAATPASVSGASAVTRGVAFNNITLGAPGGESQGDIAKKQELAWKAYDEVGEIHFLGSGLIGSSIETLAFYGAIEDNATSYTYAPPVDSSEMSERDKVTIRELIEGFRPSWGTQQDYFKAIALNLFFPGEVYIYFKRVNGKWDHKLIPKTNIGTSKKARNNKVIQEFTDPISGELVTVGDSGNLQRIWRPHPGRPANADSSMFPVLGMIDELNWIQRLVTGLFQKRIMTSGILAITNSILGPDFDPTNQDAIAGAVNSVERQWVEQLSRNMQSDTDSPALPIIVFAPYEHVKDGFNYINLDNDLPKTVIEERREVLRRIANSLDIPAEFILGLGTVNHWSAFLIRDLLWQQHIQPLATLIANSVTDVFLRPVLRKLKADGLFDGNPDRVKLWFQSHQLATHPDLFPYLVTAFDKGIIGKEPILRALGIPPESAITDEEFNLWLSLKLAQVGTTSEVGEGSVEIGDDGRIVLPDGRTPAPSRERTGNRPNGGGPANRDRAGEDGESQR